MSREVGPHGIKFGGHGSSPVSGTGKDYCRSLKPP